MKEMTISIKELLYRIFLKWRIIIIVMLIGGVILDGIGAVKSYGTVQDAQESLEKQLAAGGPKEGEQLVVVPSLEVISIKNIILGAIIGAFCVCAYVAIIYVVARKLRVKEDLPESFEIPLLGSLITPAPKKKFLGGIDQLIVKIFRGRDLAFSNEDRVRMICTDAILAVQKAGMNKIYLTGTCNDEEMELLKKAFAQELQGTIAEVSWGKSVVYTPESLEALVHSEGVIFFERIDASYYEDIQKEIELCKRYQIPIIGSVVLE